MDGENGNGATTRASGDGLVPADWTTADEIRRRTFSLARDGYDRDEVKAYLEGLSEWFVTLSAQLAQLRRAQAAPPPAAAPDGGNASELAQRMAEVLREAEAHAKLVRDEAEAEAARIAAAARHVAEQASHDAAQAKREAEEKAAGAEAMRRAFLDEVRSLRQRLDEMAAAWAGNGTAEAAAPAPPDLSTATTG